MARSMIVLLFGVLLGWQCSLGQQLECTQSGTCSCTFKNGSVIDLKPLDNPNQPLTYNDQQGNLYEYNPCSGFTDAQSYGICDNVAGCTQQFSTSYFSLGDPSSATFMQDATGVYIQYQTTFQANTLKVYLVCDAAEVDFSYTSQGAGGVYNTKLKTAHACLGGGGGGLSPGSILLITATVVLILYVTIGVIYNKFSRGAQGIEVIPHVTFWKAVPVNVKGGGVFIISKIRGKEGYQDI